MQKMNILRYISMKILSTSTSAQTLKVIPREYVSTATLVLRDDQTNEQTTFSDITLTQTGDYSVISQAFSLKEGYYYDITISSTGNVIYKDKIFCTDQTVDQSQNSYYTINQNEYTTDTSYDNDYIIL